MYGAVRPRPSETHFEILSFRLLLAHDLEAARFASARGFFIDSATTALSNQLACPQSSLRSKRTSSLNPLRASGCSKVKLARPRISALKITEECRGGPSPQRRGLSDVQRHGS